MAQDRRLPSGFHVYFLRSLSQPEKTYVGVTSDAPRRLKEHNETSTGHTARYRPWELEAAVWFKDAEKAKAFETFLKEGSGHAFAKRHFFGSPK